ncbi:Peptidase S8 S53 subtilisin kexin sedolisin [Fusarium acutatum]|uniref:Peptidase S8 S53 subtilisin kexin sedolisin n=1 Tax=Fusarium acutatum TaxID=78861 RepID=A0A8H4NNQ7_9HYPO|nr:Peptidase S8 S53 subtilisin kexin sedolisin [Fusarium acutatum]
MAGITINGNTINPAAVPGVPQTAERTNFILIQSKDVDLSLEQKLELEDHFNVEIQEYVAKNTYLCRYEEEDLEALRNLDYIKAVSMSVSIPLKHKKSLLLTSSSYLREFKSTKSLKDAVKNDNHQTEYKVDCVLHDKPNADVQEMAKHIAQAAQVDLKELQITPTAIRLTVHQDRLPELVKLDSVNRIEEVHPIELLNHDARETLNVDKMVLSTPYEGKGQTICVADSGFDQGKVIDDLSTKVHPAFPDRVELLESFWYPDDYTDKIGHGTHVCASICGTGVYKDGNTSIRGTAPAARLMVQNMTKLHGHNRWGIEAPDDLFTKLFEKPYNLGVRIHSNSWSTAWDDDKGQADYDYKATRTDQFVYEHQDFIILVAAGNHGTKATENTGHIGAASAAKNCITVGATGSKRLNNGQRWRLNKEDGHRGIEQTAQFSSRGPTKPDADGLGGRIKPDVVAPGIAILSAASRALSSDNAARTRYGRSLDPDWLYMSGTSMSTPLVAGCVALLREALQEHGKQHPSAALVKALLVNGAENFSQAIAPGLGYDYEQGFGRVDVQRSIAAVRELTFIDGGNNLENTKFDVPALRQITEQERQWESAEIPLPSGRNRIIVTLAYPDVAGGLLQHDLNLIVQSAGVERHGNMGKGDGFDHTNNVEKVIWNNVPGSTFKVVVKVYNITKPRDTAPFAVSWYIPTLAKL